MKDIRINTGVNIPLVDLKLQYSSIKEEIDLAVSRVLSSGWYLLGKELEAFEDEFASYLDIPHAIGVGSGTDALTIAVKTLGLSTEDSIVVAANVYPSAFGLSLSGVRLKLADVDKETLLIDLDSVEKQLDSTTKALVIVHLYGNPVNMTEVLDFARSHNLFVIEDCAQAAGSEFKGRKVGTFGDLGCFSFYPTKNLGTFGDGGMVVTANTELAEKAKLLRMYGEKARYESVLVGYNSRLDELQSAILRTKLPYLDSWNQKRRSLAGLYKSRLKDLPIEFLKDEDGNCVYHLLVVKVEDRDGLMGYLSQENIASAVHYPKCIHQTSSFSNLGYDPGDFPVSENSSLHITSLPIYPEMTVEQVDRVCEAIRNFFNK